jgi:hypothetical protein
MTHLDNKSTTVLSGLQYGGSHTLIQLHELRLWGKLDCLGRFASRSYRIEQPLAAINPSVAISAPVTRFKFKDASPCGCILGLAYMRLVAVGTSAARL